MKYKNIKIVHQNIENIITNELFLDYTVLDIQDKISLPFLSIKYLNRILLIDFIYISQSIDVDNSVKSINSITSQHHNKYYEYQIHMPLYRTNNSNIWGSIEFYNYVKNNQNLQSIELEINTSDILYCLFRFKSQHQLFEDSLSCNMYEIQMMTSIDFNLIGEKSSSFRWGMRAE